MITFPNCKINLGLNIVARRDDGYHLLETAFYPVPLTDVLEIVPAAGGATTLTCYGRPVDCPPEKNLVMKAYRLLESRYNLPPVDIHLTKIIPDGAGLGGGSADAAFTLRVLNDMFDLRLDNAALAALALTLGADCPFFIYNTPMMAGGIGDVLAPLSLSLAGKTLLLVKPERSVATARAYAGVTPRPAERSLADDLAKPVGQWRETIKNDFEQSVFSELPELADIKRALYDNGAVYAAMSGSGSALFGIFDSDDLASRARDKMAITDKFVLPLTV